MNEVHAPLPKDGKLAAPAAAAAANTIQGKVLYMWSSSGGTHVFIQGGSSWLLLDSSLAFAPELAKTAMVHGYNTWSSLSGNKIVSFAIYS